MRQFISFLTIITSLLFSNFAMAQSEQRFALIIDQVDYLSLAKLDGAHEEANQIANSLSKTGFEITRAQNLSKDALFKSITDFRRKLAKNPGAIGFIYYTGHGARNPSDETSDNYLLGINSDLVDPSDLPVFGVKLSEIVSSFEMVNAKAIIIVIDACRVSASFGKAASKGLTPTNAGRNILVAYSTGAGDIADVGVYAPILAQELLKSGQDVSTAFTNAKFAVNTKTNKKQLPWIDDKLTDRVCLVSCAPIPQPNFDDAEFQKTVWEMASNCAGYDIYLKKWPNGIYSSQAKQKKSETKCSQVEKIISDKPTPGIINAQKEYELAFTAFTNRDYETAIKKYKTSCEYNFMPSCVDLGLMYVDGIGVAKSYENAIALFTRACDNKNFDGCGNLGYMFEAGLGTFKSLQKAFSLYKDSCDQGISSSCSNLGTFYLNGMFVEHSAEKAAKLFLFGCDNGFAKGCLNYAVMNEQGVGIKVSYPTAREYYEKICNNTEFLGCSGLGLLYQNGYGVTKSYSKAKELFERGCKSNDQNGCINLGVLYAKGLGVEQSYSVAKGYFQSACENQDNVGCFNMGYLYENGFGVNKSLSQAKSYYVKACDLGNSETCEALKANPNF